MQEENRCFINTSNTCILSVAMYERKTHAAKRGHSVIALWNPGAETVKYWAVFTKAVQDFRLR